MVKVFITVDTEIWPQAEGWPHAPLARARDCRREIDCYFWGGEKSPRQGLPFQLEVLEAHGLRATFFVDPLYSFALGIASLREVVGAVQAAGQEVALHLHPEWLTDPRAAGLPEFAGPLMSDYSEATQSELIRIGLARLAEAGAAPIHAFRAGSWGGDRNTLRALARIGISYDSSLNACHAASMSDLPERATLLQPQRFDGVWEFPVTHFIDRPPAGRRPLQVCACSMSEFRHVLEHAHARDWHSVVAVTHSFELVRVDRLGRGKGSVGPRRLLGARFQELCGYLARHRDRFQTVSFRDAAAALDPPPGNRSPIVSSRARTVARWVSQAASMAY